MDENKNFDKIINQLKSEFKNEIIDTRDGIKIDFPEGWFHLRKSNTEPILRVYAEAKDLESANRFAEKIKKIVQ